MTTLHVGSSGRTAAPRYRGRLRLQQWSLLPIWALLIVLFGILEPHTFLTLQTFRSIASEQAITAIMALALVLPLAAGVYDLSIGGVMGISMILVAWLQYQHHLVPGVAVGLTLIASIAIGCANAVVVLKLKVNSFIATLGMLTILQAGAQWVSGGQNVAGGIPSSFKSLGNSKILTVPVPFFYMLGIAVIVWYVTTHRQTGRYMYAVGANLDAARLAGVRAERLIAIAFVVSAVLAGLAGMVFTARIGAASLGAGPPYLLPAFAATALGATQSRSRLVNVVGTVIAVYVLATGVRGLQLVGAPFWISDLFNGVALISAVALAERSKRAVAGPAQR